MSCAELCRLWCQVALHSSRFGFTESGFSTSGMVLCVVRVSCSANQHVQWFFEVLCNVGCVLRLDSLQLRAFVRMCRKLLHFASSSQSLVSHLLAWSCVL
ncbi:hypothetical protein M758_UG263500 [Ceratodon purpureus]|nr:hypothetical protein M758_UG263500 [Ceratodon purpureus]